MSCLGERVAVTRATENLKAQKAAVIFGVKYFMRIYAGYA